MTSSSSVICTWEVGTPNQIEVKRDGEGKDGPAVNPGEEDVTRRHLQQDPDVVEGRGVLLQLGVPHGSNNNCRQIFTLLRFEVHKEFPHIFCIFKVQLDSSSLSRVSIKCSTVSH